MFISRRARTGVCGRARRRGAVCSVKRCCRRGRSAACLPFVLGTNSHFISCDTRLPDHHTSVTTQPALSAAAQTCQVHLYSSMPCIISQWVSHTRWWHQSCILLWLWRCYLVVTDFFRCTPLLFVLTNTSWKKINGSIDRKWMTLLIKQQINEVPWFAGGGGVQRQLWRGGYTLSSCVPMF